MVNQLAKFIPDIVDIIKPLGASAAGSIYQGKRGTQHSTNLIPI
jgi:hypothetical protein